jgi:uncharacterized protein YlaI
MSTLPEALKKAVLEQDWTIVCKVFTSITGEPLEIPKPPEPETPDWATLEVDLGDEDDIIKQQAVAHDIKEPEEGSNLWLPGDPEPGDEVGFDEEDDEEDDIAPEVVANLFAPEPEYATQETIDKMSEVNAPKLSGNQGRNNMVATAKSPSKPGELFENENGDFESRKSPMNIPGKRVNRFTDNKNVHSNLLVSNNPDLGTKPQMAGGDRSLLAGGVETGNTVDVECALCETKETVYERLATGWNKNPKHNTYRCNDCNTRAGRERIERKKLREERENPGRRVNRQQFE